MYYVQLYVISQSDKRVITFSKLHCLKHYGAHNNVSCGIEQISFKAVDERARSAPRGPTPRRSMDLKNCCHQQLTTTVPQSTECIL